MEEDNIVSTSSANYCQRSCHVSYLDLPGRRAHWQRQSMVFEEEVYFFFLDKLLPKSGMSSTMVRHCAIKCSNEKNMILGIRLTQDQILTVFITVCVTLNKLFNKFHFSHQSLRKLAPTEF